MTSAPVNWQVEPLGRVATVAMGQAPPSAETNTAGAERADGLVQVRADPGDLGLADPDRAHRFDQVIDAAGADAVDVGLHHDRVQRLVDASAGFEDDREERALAQFRDPQLDVAGLGGQHPRPVTVALVRAVLRALVRGGADAFGGFELDQLLQGDTDRITDQIDAVTGTEGVEEFGQGRLGQGHRWTSFFDECLAVHTEDPADGPLRPHASPPALKPHHSQGLSFAEIVGGVTKDSKKQALPGMVEVPYLRVANVQRGALKLDEVTSIRVTPQKADALRLRAGDVLLNEGGDRDKLARGWVWKEEVPNCIHQNHVFRARLQIDLDPYFLSWTTNTIGGRWAERNGKQSVNLASISLSMIRRMPVIVPPGGVSTRIAAELQDRLEDVDRLGKAVRLSQARVGVLRRAVLAAAFEGKLTGRRTDNEVIEETAAGRADAQV